tara:strand:+ start:223 stop:780 length:558 start_codon:yes stop_codon:yes gene_type:complete
MRQTYYIIDDFLDDPDEVRKSVIDTGTEFFNRTGSFTGRRSHPAVETYQEMILNKLHSILPFKLDDKALNEREGQSDGFSFGIALERDIKPNYSGIHTDRAEWTGVLYLTPNAPIESGTLLFKEGSYPDPNKDDYDSLLTDTIGNVYNRLILFKGKNIPHSPDLAGFGDSVETGRLTQHFFFDEV